MQQDIDWQAIQQDYEQGTSLRNLVARYDVPKTTILRRAQSQEWHRTTDRTIMVHGPDQPPEPQRTSEPSTVELARAMIQQLATIARVPLDLKEHNLFAQALNQYNKIIVTAPSAEQSQSRLDYTNLTQEELDAVAAIFAQADARTITPIRKEA